MCESLYQKILNNPENFHYVCPICKQILTIEKSPDYIKENIGATFDCICCGSLLKIKNDMTCSDFGQELSSAYKNAGYNVSKEEAIKSYISC